jgi:hypothetical protein
LPWFDDPELKFSERPAIAQSFSKSRVNLPAGVFWRGHHRAKPSLQTKKPKISVGCIAEQTQPPYLIQILTAMADPSWGFLRLSQFLQ